MVSEGDDDLQAMTEAAERLQATAAHAGLELDVSRRWRGLWLGYGLNSTDA